MAHIDHAISGGFLMIMLLQMLWCINAKVPAIIVFGDSSVDSGNNNHISTILKSNFQPYGRDFFEGRPTGRFSNGRIPTDFISEAFGIKPIVPAYLDPAYTIKDFASGVCFASAGTGYDNATSDVLSVIPLWKEMEYYKEYQQKLREHLGKEAANELLGEALYLISLGTNDFLENYYIFRRRSSEFTIGQYQDFLVGIAEKFLRELYEAGGRKVSISGVPPMGCLPLERATNMFRGSGCVEEYNVVARDFNKKLRQVVERLGDELAGIRLVQSNPYDILMEIVDNPKSFGFEVAAQACCGSGRFEMSYMCSRMSLLTCSDANQFVFWDSFHPTERTNAIIADHVMKNSLAQFLL